MPRYRFQCTACNQIQTVFLRMSETLEDCSECGAKNSMNKVFDKFFSSSSKETEHKVGSVTKEYIEKNREILEKQKEEARSTEYESP
tara:strand:- start:653 stop:913 length:261 start_codon:yes stop_codon:yes gene_type:complete